MMVVLTATYQNGVIELEQPLPAEFEGKQIQIQIEEIKAEPKKSRRQAGSLAGQIWMAPDFDEPLDEFADYMP
jgi:predicted DNA-binding antitoxin AbrB/MazE fold protein